MSSSDLSAILPRVAIVSRRCLRKNKFVDFVGEYHLDLIVRYGAVPIIVPRVWGVHLLLESFEPIHGVLLCEGEDIDPSHYSEPSDPAEGVLSPSDLEQICLAHSSDTAVDASKDSIELRLARACLERGIPFLGICRGSQVLNVACGGTLYLDVGKQLRHSVEHIDYENYDGHRHGVEVVRGTPLWNWFGGREEIMVNSYHHQGVRRLAERFRVMALARDGLVEAFYDPEFYDADKGKFLMGLQFHPERMRNGSDEFDYPGCPRAYQEFVKAVVAYQKRLNWEANPTAAIPPKLEPEMEEKRRVIVRSFSIAKGLYDAGRDPPISKRSDLQVGADFLESNAALSLQQERRLKQMGATVRNSSAYLQRLRRNQERESAARLIMSRMSVPQLSELLSFYNMMGQICSQVLDRKLLPPSSLEEAAAANICTCNDIHPIDSLTI